MIFEDYRDLQGISENVILGTSRKTSYDNSRQFSIVYHIAHLPASKYLLESKRIIPQLIHDKSKLNSERIKVIWLSPNEWYQGSLYGNVRISYDINELIANKRFYAVEVMTEYTPVACRILITSKDYSSNPLLESFDPKILNSGPWYIDQEGKNYFHSSYNIEFMFEDELEISRAVNFDFVNHHNNFCNIFDDGSCSYLGFSSENAEIIFISHLIANDIKLKNLHLFLSKTDPIWPILSIAHFFERVINFFSTFTFDEGNKLPEKVNIQIAKSILDLIAKQKYKEAEVLSKAYNSLQQLKEVFHIVFHDYFETDVNLSSAEITGISKIGN